MARTVPAAILTGLSTGLPMFYLVKIEGSISTLYWVTNKLNLAGSTLVLKETSAGGALTTDATMIAYKFTGPSGQEEVVDGVGQIESSVDISQGGAVATVSDVDIEILNQARYDSTILAAGNNFENRPVTIYLGFIPTGTSPTVVIADDMVARWTGICDDVFDLDYSRMFLRCVDSAFLRHKDIPMTVVTKTAFSYAPKESIGKVIPAVYGSFYGTEEDEKDLMTLDPAPTVRTSKNVFSISDHELHTYSKSYVFANAAQGFGLLTDPTSTTNTASGATLTFTGVVYATFRQLPKIKGAGSSGVGDIDAAVDDSLTTEFNYNGNVKAFSKLDAPEDVGDLQATGAIRMRHGTIVGSGGKIQHWTGAAYVDALTNATYSSAQSDTTTSSTINLTLTWAILRDYEWGVSLNVDASQTGNVKVINIEYQVRMFELYGPPVTLVRSHGLRG